MQVFTARYELNLRILFCILFAFKVLTKTSVFSTQDIKRTVSYFIFAV